MIRYTNLLFFLFALFFVGCSTAVKLPQSTYGVEDQRNYEYLYYEGLSLKLQGKYAEAAKFFYNASVINPNSDAVFYELAKLHYQVKDYNSSFKYSTKAVQLSPNNKWYNSLLAESCMATNKTDSAVLVFEKLVQLSPNSYNDLYNLGLLYAQTNKTTEALKVFKKILEKYPDNQQLTLIVLELVMRVEGKEAGLNFINDRIKIIPSFTKLYVLKAEALVDMGRYPEAEDVYSFIFKEYPSDSDASLSYIELLIKQGKKAELYSVSKDFFSNSEVDRAAKFRLMYGIVVRDSLFNDTIKVEQLLNDLKISYLDDPRVYDIASIFYIKRENLNRALLDIYKYIELDKSSTVVWNRLFSILEYRGDWVNADKYGALAIENNIETPEILYSMGLAKMFLNKNQEAIDILTKFLSLENNYPAKVVSSYSILGDLYYKLNNHKLSFENYEKSLALNPDNIYVLNNYSYYLSVEGVNLPYALKLSKKTIDAEPNNPTYLDTYAWILYKLERYSDALLFIQKAISLSTEASSELYYHQGMIMLKLNKQMEAEKSLLKAKELGKDHVDELLKQFGL